MLFLSNSKENFLKLIDYILKEKNNICMKNRINKGFELAKQHSWEAITKKITTLLSKYNNERII